VAPLAYAPIQNAVLPPLQQVLPPGALARTAVRYMPLADNRYAMIHPLLFCSLDETTSCERMAESLASVTPGFGTSLMDGPDGFGMYLTFQGQ